jgi:hypothetical protein
MKGIESMMHHYPHENHPYRKKTKSPFSDDWISHNPWMDKVIAEEETPPDPDSLLAICFNFRDGVPIEAIQRIQQERKKAKEKAKSEYKVFKDMMKEGVGLRHISPQKKRWTNTRKYYK